MVCAGVGGPSRRITLARCRRSTGESLTVLFSSSCRRLAGWLLTGLYSEHALGLPNRALERADFVLNPYYFLRERGYLVGDLCQDILTCSEVTKFLELSLEVFKTRLGLF